MTKLRRLPDWTARIIIRSASGILFVRESGRPWELPGGKREPDDIDPLSTARRELEEETGLPALHGDFILRSVRSKRQGKNSIYDVYYYEAVFSRPIIREYLLSINADGDDVRMRSYKVVQRGEDFRQVHLDALRKLRCLGPSTNGRVKE